MGAVAIKDEDLPIPCGWRILVQIMQPPEKVGSIIRPNSTIEDEKHLSMHGRILAVGPLAWRRDDMRTQNAWARVGDTIIFGKYTGTRFIINDIELRLMNDDDAQAVLPNPDVIKPVPRGLMR